MKNSLGFILVSLVITAWFSFVNKPHTESTTDPLFTLLDPSQTGIQFNNKLRDTKEANIMIYSNFYGGAGVAIGDLNNDGLQDIFFAGNQVGDELYINKGNLTFENKTQQAGITDNGGWSSGVIFADVNQDGYLDIYVTRELYDNNPELRRNKLYINQGDATFKEEAQQYGIDNDQRTRHATFFDYDHDGDLDLFLCNQPPNPGDYSSFSRDELIQPEYNIKLYNYNDGKYTDVTAVAGMAMTGFPNSISATDLNNDGWVDLYVANDFWIEDWIFMNNGDGTFSNDIYERTKHISFSSMGIDAGDIDNDGDQDLIVVDMAAEDNYRSKTNMSGMNPKTFWKTVADGGHYQYMFNMLHLNQGDGYFSDVAQLSGVSSTDWSWSPLIADFDNDGWKDMYITNGLMRDIRNNDASKVYPKYLETELWNYLQKNPSPPEGFSIWDVVDINKALELVPSQKLVNYVYKNEGDLKFSKQMKNWGMNQESFSAGSAYGDLDNDGDLDLVVNNINDPAFVYQNNAIAQSDNNYIRIQPLGYTGDVSGTKVSIKTETGMQYAELTIVRGMYSTSENTVHFGLGKSSSISEVTVIWPDGKTSTLQDVNANQTFNVFYEKAKPIVIKNAIEENVIFKALSGLLTYKHIENNFDDFDKQVLLPHQLSHVGPLMTTGDLNADGLEDLFIGSPSGKAGLVVLQDASGGFSHAPSPDIDKHVLFEDAGSAFFDLEGDGDLDIYVVSGGNEFNDGSAFYEDRLYINDGTGRFKKSTQALPSFPGSKVRSSDFDGDGDFDLFIGGRQRAWSYPEFVGSVLLRNDNGILTDVTQDIAPALQTAGMVNDAKWFDYDNDGLDDLIVVGEWTAIQIFKNNGGSFSKLDQTSLDDQLGWWFSVETADMDGDGDEDIIAGNLGLNYKYKATADEPFEVYYYDFDENGKKDVVLTYYNFGIQYPLRGRQCSSEQVPVIKDKFVNYDLFASADVVKVYGESNLENALHFEATNFASVYIENLGNGQFEINELPVEAQLSSINDILIQDYNQDGHLDMLTAGNLFEAEVETARADAGFGLVMLGNGEGDFTAMSKEQSGIYLPCNVKSLTEIKTGGKSYILAGCNDEELRVYSYDK